MKEKVVEPTMTGAALGNFLSELIFRHGPKSLTLTPGLFDWFAALYGKDAKLREDGKVLLTVHGELHK